MTSAATGSTAGPSRATAPPGLAGFPAISCENGKVVGDSPIKHVIYLQFDNPHLHRDLPTVPSDLEQMPHLLNFIRSNGTMLTNDHTVLISHTANGILTALTGVYSDRQGQAVANSFRYFNPNGTSNLGVSFAYWTDGIFDPTTRRPPIRVQHGHRRRPQRAGAVGSVHPRGLQLGRGRDREHGAGEHGSRRDEGVRAGSAEAARSSANPGQAFADFVGIAIHCAQGDALCSAANRGRPDLLPEEPGGYSGFNGLFGNKYVRPRSAPGR